jgi:hypothetical protein
MLKNFHTEVIPVSSDTATRVQLHIMMFVDQKAQHVAFTTM